VKGVKSVKSASVFAPACTEVSARLEEGFDEIKRVRKGGEKRCQGKRRGEKVRR